jgi:hypothetical protein
MRYQAKQACVQNARTYGTPCSSEIEAIPGNTTGLSQNYTLIDQFVHIIIFFQNGSNQAS